MIGTQPVHPCSVVQPGAAAQLKNPVSPIAATKNSGSRSGNKVLVINIRNFESLAIPLKMGDVGPRHSAAEQLLG